MRAQRAGRRIGSFDRTYEGLKRPEAVQHEDHLPAFDRTYEGLKLSPWHLFGAQKQTF